jgi:mono/diheme cytochrome c family protein
MAKTLVLLSLLLLTTSCDFLRGYAEGSSSTYAGFVAAAAPRTVLERGAARFAFDDFNSLNTDTLETNALPWKWVVASMLTLHPQWVNGTPDEDDYLAALEREYGFVRPTNVANWPMTPSPTFARNLGIVAGNVERGLPAVRFEAVNHGCATCHAGNLWDAQGQPTHEVWLGLGATSIHLARYSDDVYAAMRATSTDPELLAATTAMMDRVFPAIDALERKSLLTLVVPAIHNAIGTKQAPSKPVPFDNGGPGMTNSVGHVKRHFHILDDRQAMQEIAFTQIPELLSMPLRSSVLCDGVYRPKGSVAFVARRSDAPDLIEHTIKLADVATLFTIGTLGVTPSLAHENLPAVREVMESIARSNDSPPFPGAIDDDKARRGLAVWGNRCAACHGQVHLEQRRVVVDEFPNALSPVAEIGTDPARALAANPDVLKVIGTVRIGELITAENQGGYVAPTLKATWATAPYLHNGSVPTLWHLMHPEERPARFEQGGHALDYDKVGIAGVQDGDLYRYPDGYTPWMRKDIVDTTGPGRTHVGHTSPFTEMSEDEKADVTELLKLF